MRKGFRPSLEPPVHRRVSLDGRRPAFCVATSTLVILLVFGIFGISAWDLYEHQFRLTSRHFHAGDQVSLLTAADDLTPVFCDGYQVTLMEKDEAFVLPHRAQVSESLTSPSLFSLHHAPSRRYSFLEAYLLHGTRLQLGACRENGTAAEHIHILLVKGRKNFQTWKYNPGCTSCLFRHVTIIPSTMCDNSSSSHSETDLEVTIKHTDQYVLVVHYQLSASRTDHSISNKTMLYNYQRPRTNGVLVSGTFNRTHYNITGYRKVCGGREDKKCNFDLHWGTREDIVVNFVNPHGRIGNDAQVRSFTTKCQLRYAFWVAIFAGFPVIVGVAVGVTFGWFLLRRSRRPSVKRLSERAERRANIAATMTSQDDASLVTHEVVQQMEEDGCMKIQD